jgi:hypothetical protein
MKPPPCFTLFRPAARWLLLALTGITALPGAAAPTRPFRAGAATSNITPALDVRLDGTIMQIGPGKHVHDELHARCLVLDDGTTRVAFAICDTTMIAPEVVAEAKRRITATTGMAPDHVLISATHTHSSPRALDLGLGDANRHYNAFFARRIADGVQRAINNLAPARIAWGSGRKPEYVVNRRSFVKPADVPVNPFGQRTDQVVMGAAANIAVRPAGPVDPEVFLLSLQHLDGRPLAVLANYGLHYVGGIPPGHISADYYGAFADRLQALLGADRQDPPFVALMSNGTSGDVKNSPAAAAPPYARMREVAHGVAEEVARVSRQLTYHDSVPITVRSVELTLAVRRPNAARLAWARAVVAKTKDGPRNSRPEIYARESVLLAEYPATVPLRLHAFRIGDLGIASIPCEVFAETGLAIKKDSPLPATFTISLANGYGGYLPTPEQHGLGGYEAWDARSSFLETGAEPKIRAGVLALLHALAGTKPGHPKPVRE